MKRESELLSNIDLSWDIASIVWKDQAGGMHADVRSADESESLDIAELPSLPNENVLR